MVRCIVHLSDGPTLAIGVNVLDICVAVRACVQFMYDNPDATQTWYETEEFWEDVLDQDAD